MAVGTGPSSRCGVAFTPVISKSFEKMDHFLSSSPKGREGAAATAFHDIKDCVSFLVSVKWKWS